MVGAGAGLIQMVGAGLILMVGAGAGLKQMVGARAGLKLMVGAGLILIFGSGAGLILMVGAGAGLILKVGAGAGLQNIGGPAILEKCIILTWSASKFEELTRPRIYVYECAKDWNMNRENIFSLENPYSLWIESFNHSFQREII